MNTPLAPVALSCGEPAGVGPEIAAKAWAALRDELAFFYIGDAAHLPDGTPVQTILDPTEARAAMAHGLPVLQRNFAAPNVPGQANAANARGVIDAIKTGVALVQSGAASALCTAPINKEALQTGADFAYPGHTEFLAALAGVDEVVMLLSSPELRVVPATIHIPLADVPRVLTAEKLEQVLRITHAGMQRDFAQPAPRIAVSGLNPHAGEGGRMGGEEIGFITPLLDKLRAEGMTLIGPLPADTMFHAAARPRYDVAVAMYHDQALIPIKTLDFDRGVNVTLGLPFIRTSPDHGTAFDIAGTGQANPSSLIEALRLANQLSHRRNQS